MFLISIHGFYFCLFLLYQKEDAVIGTFWLMLGPKHLFYDFKQVELVHRVQKVYSLGFHDMQHLVGIKV